MIKSNSFVKEDFFYISQTKDKSEFADDYQRDNYEKQCHDIESRPVKFKRYRFYENLLREHGGRFFLDEQGNP